MHLQQDCGYSNYNIFLFKSLSALLCSLFPLTFIFLHPGNIQEHLDDETRTPYPPRWLFHCSPASFTLVFFSCLHEAATKSLQLAGSIKPEFHSFSLSHCLFPWKTPSLTLSQVKGSNTFDWQTFFGFPFKYKRLLLVPFKIDKIQIYVTSINEFSMTFLLHIPIFSMFSKSVASKTTKWEATTRPCCHTIWKHQVETRWGMEHSVWSSCCTGNKQKQRRNPAIFPFWSRQCKSWLKAFSPHVKTKSTKQL